MMAEQFEWWAVSVLYVTPVELDETLNMIAVAFFPDLRSLYDVYVSPPQTGGELA